MIFLFIQKVKILGARIIKSQIQMTKIYFWILSFELDFRGVRKQSNLLTETKKEFLRCKGTSSRLLTSGFINMLSKRGYLSR